MVLFRRPGKARSPRPGTTRTASSSDTAHLHQFVGDHSGVEAYLEPRTTVTETTVVLVAGDGQWTRRRVAGAPAAAKFAREHAIPLYDAAVVGYPQRMRDWTARQRGEGASGADGRT